MGRKRYTVAEQRNYAVVDVSCAKKIAGDWLKKQRLEKAVDFGLPEVDDRYHVWRVPFLGAGTDERIGELVIDARSSLILEDKSSSMEALEARLLGRPAPKKRKSARQKVEKYRLSCLRNIIALGDAEKVLEELPAESVNLVFTSPPYYNARPEYNDYLGYDAYLLKIRAIIKGVHRVLSEGRFFVMNVSPVLLRRARRSEASKRIAVPFNMHQLFVEEGYDFVDDIIWVKPAGAGWATGRGRRFAADRNPLQYKAVPVTEYVLVYRKRTERLIDWNIRAHPNKKLVKESKIGDDYERTNVWKIKPAHSKEHPAIFPAELAERIIRYYSFKEDVVLDPFAGIGTVGEAAVRLGRRFVLIEKEPIYVKIIRRQAVAWLGKAAKDVMTINCEPIVETGNLF